MDQAVTRAASATPSTKPPVGAMGRSWAILLTSPNHGIVRPLGHLFKDASDHHERVVVVEVPAGAGAPSDQVNLVLRAAPAAEDSAGNVPTDERAAFERHERGSNLRRVGVDRDGSGGWYENPCVQSAWEGWQARAAVAAQAGQVAVPEQPTEAMLNAARDWSVKKYGQGIGNDAAIGCWKAMLAAAPSAPAVAQQAPAQAALAPAESIECWSHNEEDFNAKSLGELIDDHELEPGATVWVGEAVHPEPKSLFSTDWLIENMGEAAYDIAGEHAGEDYPNVSDEQVAELEALIVGWIAKCAPPNFWTVKNVRPYVLTAEDCGAQASTAGERQEGGQS